jgi:hypothetical protein
MRINGSHGDGRRWQVRKLILRFGWVRSTAAALTAAGVAVVFVVLIVPTAFGSSKAARGGCSIKFKSFSTDKKFLSAADDEAKQYTIAIFGSHLDRVGDEGVEFGGPAGKQWIAGSNTYVEDGGYILASPEPESVGVKGRIRIVDVGPDPDCYSVSPSEFTPKNTGADS